MAVLAPNQLPSTFAQEDGGAQPDTQDGEAQPDAQDDGGQA